MTANRPKAPTTPKLIGIAPVRNKPGTLKATVQVPGNRSKKRVLTNVDSINSKTNLFRPLKQLCNELKKLKKKGILANSYLEHGGYVKYDELEITMSRDHFNEDTVRMIVAIVEKYFG